MFCCQYRRYLYNIVLWLLDWLYCCRYQRYRYDNVIYLLDQLYCCRYQRYRYDNVIYLLDQLYSCRYRFDIDTISICAWWINCFAVDIDTISIKYRQNMFRYRNDIDDIVTASVLVSLSTKPCRLFDQLYCCRCRFDIDMISFYACCVSCIAVDIVDIDMISSK